jgi:hypothetical protein
LLNDNLILHQAFVFNHPKLHFLTNLSTILELEWQGSQLSGAKNSMFLSHPDQIL